MTKEMPQEERSFTFLIEPAEEGGYIVTCPALPGLVTEGDTLEEAREMAKDAIRGYNWRGGAVLIGLLLLFGVVALRRLKSLAE